METKIAPKHEEYVKQIMDMYSSKELQLEYPESYAAIENVVAARGDNDFQVHVNFFDLACVLHNTDGAKDMHPMVAQYCLQVYFDEYSNGNADAALNLGSLYYSGRAGEQNYAKAVEYYTYAADKGSLIASENLGYCYLYGRDVKKDYEKAFNYFLKGALTGQVISLYKIGDFYKNGYFVAKDEQQAFRIYDHCAKMMTDPNIELAGADVFWRLAECMYKGIGTEVDLKGALFFYQSAERLYYDRLEKGDYMIAKNLDKVIDAEEEVREKIRMSMPDM